jgi:hypothetical protein
VLSTGHYDIKPPPPRSCAGRARHGPLPPASLAALAPPPGCLLLNQLEGSEAQPADMPVCFPPPWLFTPPLSQPPSQPLFSAGRAWRWCGLFSLSSLIAPFLAQAGRGAGRPGLSDSRLGTRGGCVRRELPMAGLGLSDQKMPHTATMHAHRHRLQNLCMSHRKSGLLNRLPEKVSFSVFD